MRQCRQLGSRERAALCPTRTLDNLYERTLLIRSVPRRRGTRRARAQQKSAIAIGFEVPQSIEKGRYANEPCHSVYAGPFLLVARHDGHRAVAVSRWTARGGATS